MRFTFLLVCLNSVLLSACVPAREPQAEAGNTNQELADVYKPLNGKWRGQFTVYSDTTGQHAEPIQPQQISRETLNALPLKVVMTLDVEQHYVSETPYLQRVVISDTYTDADGQKRVVRSSGVNKVEDGRMLCIVDKPDERIVHSGSLDGPATIIWQRSERNPLKIEYFRESVSSDTYEIVGWGYYGDDDPDRSPQTWFYGSYRRVD